MIDHAAIQKYRREREEQRNKKKEITLKQYKKKEKARLTIWEVQPYTPEEEDVHYQMFWENQYHQFEKLKLEGDEYLIHCVQTRHHSHQELVWEMLEKYIKQFERKHFGMVFQIDQEYHMDRILALYEFFEKFWYKTPRWCLFVFRRAFSEIEAVLQCRRYGIALPHNGCILNFRTKFIHYFVLKFKLDRQKLSFQDHFLLSTGDYPKPKQEKEYELYINLIDSLLLRSPSSGIQGYGLPEDLAARAAFLEAAIQDSAQVYPCWDIYTEIPEAI